MLLFYALFPFVVLCVLMVWYKRPTHIATPIALILALGVVFFVWGMEGSSIAGSLVKSFFVSLEILAIVFSASLLLDIVMHESISSTLKRLINSITHDRRIQAILIGWIFVSFIEGLSGFGTPSLLAAPLLFSFGFSPVVSVTLSLLGDGLATTFGAVGTPIVYGIVQGVNTMTFGYLIQTDHITILSALITFVVGWAMPIFISCLLVVLYKRPLREGLEIVPYALMAWLAFFVPYLASAFFLGPEFPSIVGALVGGALLIYLTRKKIFVPKSPWRFPHESTTETTAHFEEALHRVDRVFFPFLIVLFFLFVLKFVPDLSIVVDRVSGANIPYRFSLFASPAIPFLIASVCSWLYLGVSRDAIIQSLSLVAKKMIKIGIAVFSMISIAQLFIYSGTNIRGFSSIPSYLSQYFVELGDMWPFIAPFVGAFGAFVTGSATASNLLFSSTHVEFSVAFGLGTSLVLALQTVGASLGNMISIHNIIVASSVVRLDEEHEGLIIKYNVVPLVLFLFFVGIVGLLLQKIL